jgi:peptidoglycan hydrolase-like protein with peptidoglycan-binding domain
LDRRIDRRRAAARSVRRRPLNSSAPRPDLVAAWAFALGLLLILLAAATSHGQTGGAASPASKPAGVAGPLEAATPQLGQRVLRKGTAGQDVATLQLILRSRGFGPVGASGTFDEATEQAVRRFQRAAGLTTDGLVGPQTRPALLRLMRSLLATW